MSKQPIIIITCDGGGAHKSKVSTVAAFRKVRSEFWSEIRPSDVRRQYATGKRSGIPELDALRHVTDDANQQLLAGNGVPWGTNWDKLIEQPDQEIRDRLKIECGLCKKRGTPNTLVMTERIEATFDGLVSNKRHIVSIDLVRQAHKKRAKL